EGGGAVGDVLELEGDEVDLAGEALERGLVVIGRDLGRRDMAGRRVGIRAEDAAAEAEPGGRQRRHPPELAAAEDADGGARGEALAAVGAHAGGASLGLSATASVWRARQRSSAAATAGSDSARMAAASSAALIAPALPMASVATGTPAGIWTIDSRLSSPFRACDSTGTPSTGSGVSEASIPGRWAAPPAPAMIALRPRWRAVSA